MLPECSREIETAILSDMISVSDLNAHHFEILVEFFSNVFSKTNELKIIRSPDSTKQYYVQDFMNGSITLFMAEETFLVTPFRFHQIKTYSILETNPLIQALETLNVHDDARNIAVQIPDTITKVKNTSLSSSATLVGVVKKKKSKKKSKEKSSNELESFDEDAFLNEAIKQKKIQEQEREQEHKTNQKIETTWQKYDCRLTEILTDYQKDLDQMHKEKKILIYNNLSFIDAEHFSEILNMHVSLTKVGFVDKLHYFRKHLSEYFKKVKKFALSSKSFVGHKLMPLNCDFLTIWNGFGSEYDVSCDIFKKLLLYCSSYKNYTMTKTVPKSISKTCSFYILKPLDICDYSVLIPEKLFSKLNNTVKQHETGDTRLFKSRYKDIYYFFSKNIVQDAKLENFQLYGMSFENYKTKYIETNFESENSLLYSFLFSQDIIRYSKLNIKSGEIREVADKDISDLKNIFSSLYGNELHFNVDNSTCIYFTSFGKNNELQLFENIPILFLFSEFVFQIKMLTVYFE
ncbi:hypothetical protein NUSPORA_00753 [Nucleospora cyclopteri]